MVGENNRRNCEFLSFIQEVVGLCRYQLEMVSVY